MSSVFDEKITFLRKVFGSVAVPRGKGDPSISCPKCKSGEKKKLAIRLEDDRTHCWVCGLGGRLISLLVQYKPSAVHEYITKFAGKNISLLDVDMGPPKEVVIPTGFRMLAPNIDLNDMEIRWSINYLKRRGLGNRDLWYFKFGISTDETMKRRVIMPSFNAEGKLNFYTGRAIDDNAFRKYMNCDAEKKSIIFNEINIDWTKELSLVEGPFDLTKCDDNATCLLGSSLSEDSRLFQQIYKHKTPIILALDKDMETKSWQRIARLLASYDISVKLLDLGKHKDVGEMSRAQFIEAKRNAVEWNRTSALLMKISNMKN